MSRRDVAGAVFAIVPGLLLVLLDRVFGQSLDAVLQWEWAPVAVVVIGGAVWLLYALGLRRLLGPTRADFQGALDKMVDYNYKEDSEGMPRPGLSGEGIIREHAPDEFRARWWDKLGLGRPPKRPDKYG